MSAAATEVGSSNRGAMSAVSVEVGGSRQASSDFAERVAAMVNSAYGYDRISSSEVKQRLAMGDAGLQANRVLHLAWRDGCLVGCCSSTKSTPWTPHGCGHWGLLVVAPPAQGTGVARALVRAAERRLAEAGLSQVQMEYEYTCGDEYSERLFSWYEGSLGFSGGRAPTRHVGRSEFRRCRKSLKAMQQGDGPPCSCGDRDAMDLQSEQRPSRAVRFCSWILRSLSRAIR
jgi:GNAT superfamily N-acetyltransferase